MISRAAGPHAILDTADTLQETQVAIGVGAVLIGNQVFRASGNQGVRAFKRNRVLILQPKTRHAFGILAILAAPRQRAYRPPPVETGPSREQAAEKAGNLIARAKLDVHTYLARKGFPERKMLVLGETLLVPMRPIDDYQRIASVQMIRPDGGKRFLKGGRASSCVYHLGLGSSEQWWCEGLATGLSILAALRLLSRRARVTVCFSALNLARAARRGIVIADHDEKSGAGEKAARATGLRWWMPPEPGDANDFHQKYGLKVLADELRRVLVGPAQHKELFEKGEAA